MNELFLGESTNGERLTIDRDDLTTHALVVGRTGTGKTGLIHVLVEEAVMAGVSVVVLDPKGDLTNLLLAFPSLTAREFAPWVAPGIDPSDEAQRWADGLKKTGQSAERVAEWRHSAVFNIFTPGYSKSGQGVNLLPSLAPPDDGANFRETAAHVANAMLSAISADVDPLTDPRSVFLTELLLIYWQRGEALPLEAWPELIVTPPGELEVLDGIGINDLFPKRDRMKLASTIIGFRRQASRWLEGPALNMDDFLLPDGATGRPRVTIFTLRHLDHDDRMLFTSMFLNALVEWMFKAQASGTRLRALCVLDEAAGYLPPHPLNPPTKRPICTLLAQGRAQGLGVLLATQNPNDIDYKALSNVGTWFLGGLRSRDLQRDLDSILNERGVEAGEVLKLPAKTFMALTKNGDAHRLRVRWTLSYLRGPIDVSEIGRLVTPVAAMGHSRPPETPMLGKLPKRKTDSLYGFINIEFGLTDDASELLHAEIQFSTDNGSTWRDCMLDKDTHEMESSPVGTHHCLEWDSVKDLGFRYEPNVLIKVQVPGRNGVIFPAFEICNNILNEEPSTEY